MTKAFLLVLILAGGLRLASLTFDSLWLDESYQTVVEAYGNGLPGLLNAKNEAFLYKPGQVASCKSVLANFRHVDPLCPPLYAILLNRWLTVCGGSDYALRSFSVLCSLLSIAAIGLFGTLLLGKRPGLYAALLQAISPFDIYYAQEARMYSLATLCAVVCGGSLLYLCTRKKSAMTLFFAVLYIISTWALINTHYTQLPIWAFAVATVFVLAITSKDLMFLGYTLACNVFVLLLSIPWVSLFCQAAALRTAAFYVIRQGSWQWPFWALIVRLPFNWLTFLIGKKLMLWAIPGYLTAGWLIGYFILLVFKKKNQSLTLLLLVLWSIVPAIMIWLLDVVEMHRVIEIPRYLIGTAPAIFLIAGYAAADMEKKKYFLPFLIAHTIFCLANNAYMHIVPQRENWQAVARTIEHVRRPDEPLFVSPYYNIVCLDRYLHYPLRQIGAGSACGGGRLENMINNTQAFWVLSAQEGDTIFNIIPERYKIAQTYDFMHALHLKEYILRSK